jgi:dihydroorotase
MKLPVLAFGVALAVALATFGQAPFDVVLSGGRVMDPASGLDAVRNVGIREGRIAEISEAPLRGSREVDVTGLVVAPGFIDLHAHGQDVESSRWQALDGVTTALELEGGAVEIDDWYASREGKARIHYGASAGHILARGAAMMGEELDVEELLGAASEDLEKAAHRPASAEERTRAEAYLRDALDAGALGIGMGIAYVPGATREEVHRVFQIAAERRVTLFVHVRYAGQVEPGSSVEAIHEMIANAASTGASVHIVHIGSSGLRQVPLVLDLIEGARLRGLDVSTEVYPYTAASTAIQSAIFDDGWREMLGADYDAIEWVETGERLDAASFARYREQGGVVIAHIIPEDMVDMAVSHPMVMIASDGVPFVRGRAHPRGAGTFARVLGQYAREKKSITLMDALRKMTVMPAERLRSFVPQMADKGRIQVGADADVTVFRAEEVIDRATFAEPAQASAGIAHVLVGGTFVVESGKLVEEARPGKAIRRPRRY